MPSQEHSDLSTYLANDIHEHAEVVVDTWIEWITDGLSIRPARMLPGDEIRNHIPAVIRGISEAVRGPVSAVGAAFGSAKTHARLRHDRGFDIEELLTEYEGLGRFVSQRMMHALKQYPGETDPLEVGRIFSRTSEALASIVARTVGVYRSTEVEKKRELHEHLKDYIHTITHELKQPLNAITAGASRLEDQGDDCPEEKRERYLQIIRRGVDRSVHLIDDIRTLVVMEGAQRHEQRAPLESAVTMVLREMSEHARKKDVQIHVEEPLPSINVDLTRVEIVLVNLISNAIKYSDPAKPERRVEIAAAPASSDDDTLWEIRITDNGLGIPETVGSQIFERSYRAHPGVGEGTGLGLAISQQLIEQVSGRIWFDSTEGEGSVFRFVLPAYLDEPPDGA